MIQRTVRRLLSRGVTWTPLPEFVFRHRARKHLTILTYHRILPRPSKEFPFDSGVISATPEEFAREVAYVQRALDLISMPELAAGLRSPDRLPERPAVITFDDGYRDNYEIAFPILREAGVSACIFLATRIVGTRAIPWWDQVACCMKHSRVPRIESPFGATDPPYLLGPEEIPAAIRRFQGQMKRAPWPRALECLGDLKARSGVEPEQFAREPLFMTWEEARELSIAGIELGGHTRTHPIVSHLEDRARLRDEIAGCYRDITEEIGRSPLAFAYPVGSAEAMSPEADEEIERAGFRLSFSFIHSFACVGAGAFRIPRLHVGCGEDHRAFRLQMALAPRPV